MSDVHKFLKDLRQKKKMTLRDAAIKSGLSHSYISSLEQGKHPKTKAPINPSPESLERLSEAYNYSYEELMKMAGYLKENKKESAGTLPESEYERVITSAETRYGVSLRDDPAVLDAVRQMIDIIAQERTKKDSQ